MSLRGLIDEMVANSLARSLPKLTRRSVELPSLPGKADVVTGMRRVGKTSLLFQSMSDQLRGGVARERLLYVNFEDERLLPLGAEELHLVPDAFYKRHPGLREEEVWFFFDEIHVIPGWERFVRRLLDGDGVRIVITGSSARLLSTEIATSLRGRSLSTELLPFSFAESLRHVKVETPGRWPPPAKVRSRLEAGLARYLDVGGFPEAQGLSETHRFRVLQEYVDVTMLRDVVERHGVRNVAALRYLVRRLVRNPASLLSVHRLYNDMKSQGLTVSKDTLYSYLEHLADAHLVHLVSTDARSERRRTTSPRKCYLVDHGLAVAHSLRASRDTGHLLENAVCTELRRRGLAVSYIQTENGYEVDFAARGPRGGLELVQVCADLSDPETRDRELRALSAAMEEKGAETATLVTLAEQENVKLPVGNVRIVPAWHWLLEAAK